MASANFSDYAKACCLACVPVYLPANCSLKFLPCGEDHVAISHRASNFGKPMVFLGARTIGSPIWTDTRLGDLTLADVIYDRGIDAYYVDSRGVGFASPVNEMRTNDVEGVSERYSAAAWEADIELAIEHIVATLGQAIPLVSYSSTAIPATRLMIRRPELFSAGLMISPHWPYPESAGHPHMGREIARLTGLPHFRFLVSDLVTRIENGNRTGTPLLCPEFAAHFGEVLERCQPDTYRKSDNSWIAPVGHVIDVYRTIFEGRAYYPPKALQTPVMIACSKDDVECPPAMSQRIADQLTCRHQILLGTGVTHFWLFEVARLGYLHQMLDAFEVFMNAAKS
jgi:pimeloyl-ACP methyl ester carboxylesterase